MALFFNKLMRARGIGLPVGLILALLFILGQSPAIARNDSNKNGGKSHGNHHDYGHSHKHKHKKHKHKHHHDEQEPVCHGAQTIRLDSARILGGHKIYFASESLKSISKNTRILSATLYLQFNEHPKFEQDDMTIAFNGQLGRHIYGRSPFIFHTHEKWHAKSSFRNLRINGAHHAVDFVRKIFLHKGKLVVWVHGPVKVKNAQIELSITDRDEEACPPPPPPTPVTPSVEIVSVSPADNPTNQTNVTFTFESDQDDVTFTCSVNGAANSLCTSPWTVADLASGSHHFEVIATNSAGLASTAATYDWSVDNTPVEVKIDSVNPMETTTNSSSIALAFSSSKASASFECAIDGGAYNPCASPVTFSGLLEGTHTIAITGKDSLGNTSTVPAEYTWTVDQTAPVASLLQAVHADANTNFNDPTFTFSADESASFECALDGASFTACQSPIAFTGLTEGLHQFSVRAIDAAGNQGAAATYAWQIDTTAPQILLGNVVPAAGVTNSSSVSVEFNANEAATFACAIDGAAAVDCASPYIAEFVTEGAHELVITATDLAGNAATPTVLNWMVDFTPPQISFGAMIPSAASVIASSTLTITLVGSESFVYQAALDGQALAQTSGATIALNALSEGAHSFTLQAYDLAGNPAAPLTHTFAVDTVRPVVTISSAQYGPATNQTSNLFTFTASEAVRYECDLDSAGYGPCDEQFLASGLSEGAHTFSVRGVDAAGLVSDPASFSWSVDLTAPKTTIVAAMPAGDTINSSTISIEFSVSESGATSYCSMDSAPAVQCASPFTASGLANGIHTFQVLSVDSVGNKEGSPVSYVFTVDVDTTPPVVSLQSTPSPTDPSAITFTFMANEAAAFACSLDGQPYAACTSPVSYTGLAEGDHTFSVIATDTAGNQSQPATESFTITTAITTFITNVTPSETSTNSSSISFSFASNLASATFVCSLDGAAFAACTSPASYSGLTSGAHTFTVKAVDGAGNMDPVGASHSWTVDTTRPLITSITATSTSTSFTVSWTTNEPSTGILTWGEGTPPTKVVVVNSGFMTSHTVTITGLKPSTVYSYIVSGKDAAGNDYATPTRGLRTPAP